ncbi:MAG: class I SAM-dependent methyltransferase, partial [Magnetococcales bacterium]|nr:class I SAM-dependent methyltransferase [Magnetococcales bacterium]
MNEWTDGYVADMTYTSGFYPEMTPGNMMLIHTLKSMRCGDYLEKSFNYCELGFGRGLGLAMMAAGYPHGRFWGVDLNPSHVVTAQRLAATAGLENLTLQEASFRQFAATETPKFDIIALHGVYSWISPE